LSAAELLIAEIRALREEVAELRHDVQCALRLMLSPSDRRSIGILFPGAAPKC
jgi:hypothetical protein